MKPEEEKNEKQEQELQEEQLEQAAGGGFGHTEYSDLFHFRRS